MTGPFGEQRVEERWSPALREASPATSSSPATPPAAPAPTGTDVAHGPRSLALCERQLDEATAAAARVLARVVTAPESARGEAERLAGALDSPLADAGTVCLRLLTARAGVPRRDEAAAHSVDVAVLSLMLARSAGLTADERRDVGVGALLHDVGNLDLRHLDAASREGPPAEFDERKADGPAPDWRLHVALGVARGRRLGLSRGALTVIAQHHERADGAGYPAGLPGARIAATAGVVALVNRYDHLCNPPWPRLALTPHEAIARLFGTERHAFDAGLLAAFVRMMGVYPPGSTVQLSDDRRAVVLETNPARPLRPRLVVDDGVAQSSQTLVIDLDQQLELVIRRSLPAHGRPAVRSAVDRRSVSGGAAVDQR